MGATDARHKPAHLRPQLVRGELSSQPRGTQSACAATVEAEAPGPAGAHVTTTLVVKVARFKMILLPLTEEIQGSKIEMIPTIQTRKMLNSGTLVYTNPRDSRWKNTSSRLAGHGSECLWSVEDKEAKTNFGYVASSRPTWVTIMRPDLQKRRKRRGENESWGPAWIYDKTSFNRQTDRQKLEGTKSREVEHRALRNVCETKFWGQIMSKELRKNQQG